MVREEVPHSNLIGLTFILELELFNEICKKNQSKPTPLDIPNTKEITRPRSQLMARISPSVALSGEQTH